MIGLFDILAANGGAALDEANRAIAEVNRAVTATGRGGSVTLRIVIKPVANSAAKQLAVSVSVSAKVPRKKVSVTLFADKDGVLHATNPQPSMSDEAEPAEPPAPAALQDYCQGYRRALNSSTVVQAPAYQDLFILKRTRDPVPVEFRDCVNGPGTNGKNRPAIRAAWRLFDLMCEHAEGVSVKDACAALDTTIGTMRNAVSTLRHYTNPLQLEVVAGRGGYRFGDLAAARQELKQLRQREIARWNEDAPLEEV